MRKVLTLSLAVLMILGLSTMALATDTDVYWSGNGTIDASMSNALSSSHIWGSGNGMSGEFHASDTGYSDPVFSHVNDEGEEVYKTVSRIRGWTEASFGAGQSGGGEYNFKRVNDLTAGTEGKDKVTAYVTSSNYGFLDINMGNQSRAFTSLQTHGYGDHDWSGTDSPVVGAHDQGGQYFMSVGATADHDEDGTPESSYSATISGNGNDYGKAGIGTWKAGSNSVVTTGNNVSGKILVKGEGAGSWSQNFNNADIDGSFDWDN